MNRRDFIALSAAVAAGASLLFTSRRPQIGVIPDSHGDAETTRRFAWFFKSRGVDLLLAPGDLCLNVPLRYPRLQGQIRDVDDTKEATSTLEALAEPGLPFAVIPGNHETKSVYHNVMRVAHHRFPHMIDMNEQRTLQCDGYAIVSMPGFYHRTLDVEDILGDRPVPEELRGARLTYLPDDGFYLDDREIALLPNLAYGLDGTVILLSHGAPKMAVEHEEGPAVYPGLGDLGSQSLADAMAEAGIAVSVTGHTHKQGGIAVDLGGNLVVPGMRSSSLLLNGGVSFDERAYFAQHAPGLDVDTVVGGDTRTNPVATELFLGGGNVLYRAYELSDI